MGRSKRLRKQIATIMLRIEEHKTKIEAELQKKSPQPGLIEHWKREIRNWEVDLERKRRRWKGR